MRTLSITQTLKRYGLRDRPYQLYKGFTKVNVFFKMNFCLQRIFFLTPMQYNVRFVQFNLVNYFLVGKVSVNHHLNTFT